MITIEGLARPTAASGAGRVCEKHLGFQCGYCTPGMILGAYALLLKNPKPTRAEIVRHMEDHLCRCGTHVRVIQAVETAAAAMKEGAMIRKTSVGSPDGWGFVNQSTGASS